MIDLSPSALTQLETLTINDNAIVDVSALTALENLKSINVSGNTGLSSLVGLNPASPWEELVFSNTAVNDIELIKDFTGLKRLIMENTAVTSLNPVASLTSLEEGAFLGNEITRDEANCPPWRIPDLAGSA